jgi:cytochrome c oxidase cbb3-type subunit 1
MSPQMPIDPTEVPLKAPADSEVTPHDVEQVERALIDASTRLPVLVFYGSAILWLLLGTLLAGLTSWKLPDLLANCSWLTSGRVRPAHMNVMVYGWASRRHGTAIWLMARLSRTTQHPGPRRGAAFWNLGVLRRWWNSGWRRFGQMARIPDLRHDHALPAYSLVVRGRSHVPFVGDSIYITQWYCRRLLWFPVYSAAGQRSSSRSRRDAIRRDLVVRGIFFFL